MRKRMLAPILILSIALLSTAPQKNAKPPKQPAKSVAAWLAEKLGIDPLAYANMTGVRKGADEITHGRRLVELDVAGGLERTLWDCGSCWSPALVNNGIAVLRDDEEGIGIWIVPDQGTPHLAVRAPHAVALMGETGNPPALAIAISDPRCGKGGGAALQLAEADLAAGTIRTRNDAPCLVPPLPSRDRIAGNRLAGTTASRDSSGKRVPRRLIVIEPANKPKPVAKRLGTFNDSVDRFDPVWRGASHVVYIANP